MELARVVQRLHAGDELAQRGQQAVHVGGRVAALLGDRRNRQGRVPRRVEVNPRFVEPRGRPGPLDVTQKVRPAYELHREEDAIALGPHELVKANEVRVDHPDECPELLFELVKGGGVEVQDRLQRDVLPALAVARQVNGSHGAAADAANHLKPLGPLPVDDLRRGRGTCWLSLRPRRFVLW